MPTKKASRRTASAQKARKAPVSKSIYERITKRKNPKWADKVFN